MQTFHLFLLGFGSLLSPTLSAQTSVQNNHLKGRVLYQSSGNKPAAGVQIKEKDSNGAYSQDNGAYHLIFQTKRSGSALILEVGTDTREGKKIELVNEKEISAAKLPASLEEALDIIVCPAGQRDIAAQKYYRILRTTADRELEKKKKEVEGLLAQKDKDYQKISDLFYQLDQMQAALDSVQLQGQAFSIASINLDRASQMVKDAMKKMDEENDVEGALKILNTEDLAAAYKNASTLKKQGREITKKGEIGVQEVIEGYEFKISILEPLFRYEEIATYHEIIAQIHETENSDIEKVTENLFKASYYYSLSGNTQKRVELNLKNLTIIEKHFPLNHKNWVLIYTNLGTSYGELGEYHKSLEFNLKALVADQKDSLIAELDLAWIYHNIARSYANLGQYKEQLDYGIKALQIREKMPIHFLDLSASYDIMISAYNNLTDYKTALDFSLKNQTLLEESLLNGHLKLATMYNNLAFTYQNLGNYDSALKYNLKALHIFGKHLPLYHPELAASIGNVAASYYYLNDYKNALEFFLRSVSIKEKVLPFDHPDLATSYINISQMQAILLDYPKQLEFLLKASKIYEVKLQPDHPNLAILYNSMASAYANLGEYAKSLEFSAKALAIQKFLPANHPDLAISYNMMSYTYWNMEDFNKSIEYGQKAIQIGESSDPKHRNLNRFYLNVGIAYLKSGKYNEAQTRFKKSEAIKQDERVYRSWAMYYALQKKNNQSLKSLQKAVSLGFKDLKWLETEPDLKNIRKEKGYKDIVAQLKKQ